MAIASKAPLGAAVRIAQSTSLRSQRVGPLSSLPVWQNLKTKSQSHPIHTVQASINKHRVLHPAGRMPQAARTTDLRSPAISKHSCRKASTNTSAGSVADVPGQARAGTGEALTWNEFLRLRKIRRRFNLAASTTLAAMSFVGGLGWLSEQNLEQLGAHLFGLEPLLVMGLSALGFAGAGWVLGPFIGSAVWRASYSSRVKGMATKERDFFNRIKRYRVDPTQSSVQNPTPDYYGEKITSVQGYRQWLKDQRAFNRKRQPIA